MKDQKRDRTLATKDLRKRTLQKPITGVPIRCPVREAQNTQRPNGKNRNILYGHLKYGRRTFGTWHFATDEIKFMMEFVVRKKGIDLTDPQDRDTGEG